LEMNTWEALDLEMLLQATLRLSGDNKETKSAWAKNGKCVGNAKKTRPLMVGIW
jgi:hypothetical protein